MSGAQSSSNTNQPQSPETPTPSNPPRDSRHQNPPHLSASSGGGSSTLAPGNIFRRGPPATTSTSAGVIFGSLASTSQPLSRNQVQQTSEPTISTAPITSTLSGNVTVHTAPNSRAPSPVSFIGEIPTSLATGSMNPEQHSTANTTSQPQFYSATNRNQYTIPLLSDKREAYHNRNINENWPENRCFSNRPLHIVERLEPRETMQARMTIQRAHE